MNVTNSTNALETFKEGVSYNLNLNNLLVNGSIAIIIFVLGIILGKLVSKGLKFLLSKLDLQKHVKGSLLDLIIALVRWSLYLVALHMALRELGIPIINQLFGNVLITIPSFIASLIILSLGFAIGAYIKQVVKGLETPHNDFFSKLLFYFTLYIFGVYAAKVALITLGSELSNYIVIALIITIPIIFACSFFAKGGQKNLNRTSD